MRRARVHFGSIRQRRGFVYDTDSESDDYECMDDSKDEKDNTNTPVPGKRGVGEDDEEYAADYIDEYNNEFEGYLLNQDVADYAENDEDKRKFISYVNMSLDTGLIENYDCRHVVVARWTQIDQTAALINAKAIVNFFETVGYRLGQKNRIGFSLSSNGPEQYIILPMISVDEAKRICNDSETKGFGLNSTIIHINPLIGVNGIRLQDGNDFLRVSQECFNNSEMMDLFVISIRLELPERLKVIENGLNLIKRGISELVDNASCETFGSFSSKVRRTGFSDIDINVESVRKPGQQMPSPRPLKQILAYPKCITDHPLTKAELESYPQEETVKILFHCFNDNPVFKNKFRIRFVPARTPILIFNTITNDGMNVSYDISICNQRGVDKADLLDEFIIKDRSEDNKMKNAMLFIVHWARTNKLLPGAYSDEKLEPKTNLNSYIFNQLIIHFVQAAADKIFIHPQARLGARVDDYNFDTLFGDYVKFLSDFFKYYASFDFTTKAIYGKQAMQKTTLANVHGAKVTPLMMMDPMDCTHNISAKVTEEAMKQLNGLIRNTLFILKQKQFRLNLLLETNETAVAIMKNRESKISVTAKMLAGTEKHYMSVQLPDVIETSNDLMLLLTRILRFDVSPNYQGPSVYDLYNTGGVVFCVQSKSWIGRRKKKHQMKSARSDLTPLQLDVICSDTYQYEDQMVAEIRVVMGNAPKTTWKFAYIEMMHGQVSDVRDAMHYLMDQFVFNNIEELSHNGIQSIAKIPTAESMES
ncbi:hypothetical protein GCK72_018211 [Caenorhabditis remanei]|uniref:PAP-associated domain-containing protein n=2 Tax=Caenorhabditis remanei TaxID=31234 RepID=A0A6A5G9A6_CAERE|nr:hypothetical protein GCK72_018211 [Caenorhabditis remanei]KAF1751657.1 hypothetical protein GCK72_018211 [Caenorhabditis remanei]